MATRDFLATPNPADLRGGLMLTDGQAYSLQNVSPDARVFVRWATGAAPTGVEAANQIPPGGTISITPTAGDGESCWVWSDPGGAMLIVNEA